MYANVKSKEKVSIVVIPSTVDLYANVRLEGKL